MDLSVYAIGDTKHGVKQLVADGLPSGAKRIAVALEHLINALPGEIDGSLVVTVAGSVTRDSECDVLVSVKAKVKTPLAQQVAEANK